MDNRSFGGYGIGPATAGFRDSLIITKLLTDIEC